MVMIRAIRLNADIVEEVNMHGAHTLAKVLIRKRSSLNPPTGCLLLSHLIIVGEDPIPLQSETKSFSVPFGTSQIILPRPISLTPASPHCPNAPHFLCQPNHVRGLAL